MIKTLIIDDERLAREELKAQLSIYSDIEITGEAEHADEGIEFIESTHPDLIFLDIQMPEKTGFELLEELMFMPAVIFCSAYDEFALKAFEKNALDYILKPINPERLKESLQKVRKHLLENAESENKNILTENRQVFLKDGDNCWFVKVGDIRLIESVGNYARIFFNDNKPLIHRTLNELDRRLSPDSFFRANRKEIINLRFIEKIEPYFSGGLLVYLKSGEKIEVSRRQAIRFREVMSL